jgi:uncharacterized membrane protein YcaP (DUF421 family)
MIFLFKCLILYIPNMNPVLRGLAIYAFLFLVFRISGKKSLSETTTFDFVLLLIISEATTDALIGEDYSLTASFVMVATLVGADFFLVKLKEHWPLFDKISDGIPLVIVEKGKPLEKRMKKSKVDKEDIMEAARDRGLERLDQIKYAVLERDGKITIIPSENT